MKASIILLGFFLSTYAAAQTNPPIETPCSRENSHAEQRTCLISENAKSERFLVSTEKNLIIALQHWDEDAGYKVRSITALKSASTSFRRMRTIDCEFQATLATGGNGAGDMRLICQIEFNMRRIAQLQNVTKSLSIERQGEYIAR